MSFNKFDLSSLDIILEVTEWNLLNTPERLISLTCAMITVFRSNSIPFVLLLPQILYVLGEAQRTQESDKLFMSVGQRYDLSVLLTSGSCCKKQSQLDVHIH